MNDNNFSALDRLMDFGLCLGMAQQMVKTMNTTMQTMQLPESSKPLQEKPDEWFVAIEGKPQGPFSNNEIKALLLEQKITKDNLVWKCGFANWQKAENTPEILKLLIQLPPSL